MSITSTPINSATELTELLSPLLAQATPSSTTSHAYDEPNVFNFSQSPNAADENDVDDNSTDEQILPMMDNRDDDDDDDVADVQDNNKQVIFLLFF